VKRGAADLLGGRALRDELHGLTAAELGRDFDLDRVSGIEVDLVLGEMQVAIEAKSSERITRDHSKGLRSLIEDHPGSIVASSCAESRGVSLPAPGGLWRARS
jgi:hypothetical protein